MAGANIPDIALDPEKEILKVHEELSSFYSSMIMCNKKTFVALYAIKFL